VIARAHVHVLDEAHDDPGPTEMLDQVQHRVIIESALDDRVDLHWREAGTQRCMNAREYLVLATEAAAHAAKHIVIEAVEAHGHALQSVRLELGRVPCEQYTVGGQGHVIDAGYRREIADEIGEVGAQQRLTAGQADLAHAEAHEQACETRDFLERQPLARFEELVVLVKGLARHAIRTAEIAAIHHRDAQVVQRAPTGVHRDCRAAQRNDLRCGSGCHTHQR